jgi:DNA-directed RNA polymerase specialized sigma24 family protein
MHSKLEAAAFASQQGSSPGDDAPGLAIEALEDERGIAAFRQLPSDQREVLLLRMVAGLTVAEVAAVLGKSTGAVKALQHRGRATLVRLLEQLPSVEPQGDLDPSPDLDQLR